MELVIDKGHDGLVHHLVFYTAMRMLARSGEGGSTVHTEAWEIAASVMAYHLLSDLGVILLSYMHGAKEAW